MKYFELTFLVRGGYAKAEVAVLGCPGNAFDVSDCRDGQYGSIQIVGDRFGCLGFAFAALCLARDLDA